MHLYMLILVGFSCKIVSSVHGCEQDEVCRCQTGCELVLEETHYHVVLMSRSCSFIILCLLTLCIVEF
jgi:hypothetical protein